MTTLTVLQLNAWMSGTMVPDGINRIAQIIKGAAPDVVILCEVTTAATVAITNALGSGWYSIGDDARNGIIAKWPVTQTERSVNHLRGTVAHPARPISVYSIHLEYTYYVPYLVRGYGGLSPRHPATAGYGWGPMPRPLLEAADLRDVNLLSGRPQVVDELTTSMRAEVDAGTLVIAGGDFNEPSDLDWTIEMMYLYEHRGVTKAWESSQIFRKRGFVDAYREKHPDPVAHPGLTWPASVADAEIGTLTSTPLADMRDRIDFIFHDPKQSTLADIQIIGPPQSVRHTVRVNDVDADDFMAPAAAWPSDHRGHVARFTY